MRLADIRSNARLHNLKFLKNSRMPISMATEDEYREILRMGGIIASPGMALP